MRERAVLHGEGVQVVVCSGVVCEEDQILKLIRGREKLIRGRMAVWSKVGRLHKRGWVAVRTVM